MSLLECCSRGSGMRDDFAVSLEAADDGAESGDRLNEGLTELNPPFPGQNANQRHSIRTLILFLPFLANAGNVGGNTLLVQSFSVAMDLFERKAKDGGRRAKGEVRTGKNPAQYSALSANRLHSVSGKITSSLFPSSAVARFSCRSHARCCSILGMREGGRAISLSSSSSCVQQPSRAPQQLRNRIASTLKRRSQTTQHSSSSSSSFFASIFSYLLQVHPHLNTSSLLVRFCLYTYGRKLTRERARRSICLTCARCRQCGGGRPS